MDELAASSGTHFSRILFLFYAQPFRFGSKGTLDDGRVKPKEEAKAILTSAQSCQTPNTSSVEECVGVQDLLPPFPLRLIIIGHNPSDHAWRTGLDFLGDGDGDMCVGVETLCSCCLVHHYQCVGHYYSNPTNWMWRILKETGIASPHIRGPEDDRLMPELAGVGFTDLGSGVAGTHSNKFSTATLALWRMPLFTRLAEQALSASRAPKFVAFSGKRQFTELFPNRAGQRLGKRKQLEHQAKGGSLVATVSPTIEDVLTAAGGERCGKVSKPEGITARKITSVPSVEQVLLQNGRKEEKDCKPDSPSTRITLSTNRPSTIAYGRQWILPSGWPLPLDECEVWVVPSTSGAAALSREERWGPWQALAQQLETVKWSMNEQEKSMKESGNSIR